MPRKALIDGRSDPKRGRTQNNDVWLVYIIRCSDESLYTGITTNIKRRYHEHFRGTGARYFRGREPEEVVYLETGHSRSSAAKREYELKAMTRTRKDQLIASARDTMEQDNKVSGVTSGGPGPLQARPRARERT